MTTRKEHAKRHVKPFTDLWIRDKLAYAATGQQIMWWDTEQTGLALLVGAKTKTFRCQVKLNGQWITYTLGRYPELTLASARKQADQDRQTAAGGTDPRPARKTHDKPQQAAPDRTYGAIVDLFIEHYAKPRQRTWDQTERVLKVNCLAWLKRPMDEITKQDARDLLRGFIADGHPYKARNTRCWLKKLWRWAYEDDLITAPIMEAVRIDFVRRKRKRVFTEDEIRATWAAASQLAVEEATFIKLIMLLAPRKTSLACITKADLNSCTTLWTIPFDLTKSRKTSDEERTYLVPLPPLCQRLFKGVMKEKGRLLPTLPVYLNKAGRRHLWDKRLRLKARLVKLGAPTDFQFHAWRDTIATFLQNAGHSKWERGLVLNHAESGVTADYSHGYPLSLKLDLLTKWCTHVEGLVSAPGVAMLR